MILSDAYNRIVFKVGTPDDTSGRAINSIVKNKTLLDELYDQIKSYANITKGIQDVYSFALNQNIYFVQAPTLALRSRGYFYAYVIVNATIFPMDFRGSSDVYQNFRVNPVNGITNWIMPWNAGHSQYLAAFPANSSSALTTTITANISASDTTIPVASTSGMISRNGRVTIGSEKILYVYTDSTNLYGCVRGVEQTTAATHTSGDTVTENNVFILYSRLPIDTTISTADNNVISAALLATTLDPCDEHMEGIIKATVYNLLLKIDRARAADYKIDSTELYEKYAKDISAGYARNRMNVNIRSPYPGNESGVPYGTNLLY